MASVTTVLVAFILLCAALPKLIRHRPQFYAAFVLILAVILLQSLAEMSLGAFGRFILMMAGLFQIFSLALLVLACGGMSFRELMEELTHAFEVVRDEQTPRTGTVSPPTAQPGSQPPGQTHP